MTSYAFTEFKYALRNFFRKWWRPFVQVLIAAVIGLGSVSLWKHPEGAELDHWVLRHFFQVRGDRIPPSDLVIVAIDDESYVHLNASTNFPLPRRFIADALEAINSAAPKAVIIDGNLPAQPNMEPEADARIEAALRAGPTSIWTGEAPAELTESGRGPEAAPVVIPSDERFQRAAKMQLPMTVSGEAETVVYVSYGTAPNMPLYDRVPIAKALVELAGLNVAEPGPYDLINFYGPKGTFPHVSLHKLTGDESEASKGELRGKIVLLGYHSQNRGRGVINKDEFAVPVSLYPMFGIEIHANIIGNLIDRSWLRQPPLGFEQMILLCFGLVMPSLALHLRPTWGVVAVAGMTASWVCVCYLLFARQNMWISGIGAFLVEAAATFMVIGIFGIVKTERFQRKIKRVLGFDWD